jgi:hypothetical protein
MIIDSKLIIIISRISQRSDIQGEKPGALLLSITGKKGNLIEGRAFYVVLTSDR